MPLAFHMCQIGFNHWYINDRSYLWFNLLAIRWMGKADEETDWSNSWGMLSSCGVSHFSENIFIKAQSISCFERWLIPCKMSAKFYSAVALFRQVELVTHFLTLRRIVKDKLKELQESLIGGGVPTFLGLNGRSPSESLIHWHTDELYILTRKIQSSSGITWIFVRECDEWEGAATIAQVGASLLVSCTSCIHHDNLLLLFTNETVLRSHHSWKPAASMCSWSILSGGRDSDSCKLIFSIKWKADKSKMLRRVKVSEQAEIRWCTNNDIWARNKSKNQQLET